jgi:hypothetical protein
MAELDGGKLDPARSRQQHHKSAVVNATTDGETAAYYASFDFSAFSDKYFTKQSRTSFNFGVGLTDYGTDQRPYRTFQLQADHLSYPVFAEHGSDPDLYSSGYIYILDRSDFRPSSITPGQQRSDHEWSADHAVTPLAIIKIGGKSIGPTIVIPQKLVQNEH